MWTPAQHPGHSRGKLKASGVKEVGGQWGEGRRTGGEERQEEERHYRGRVGMPLALAVMPWMVPPGTKLTPTAPDTGCPRLARPDLTHAYTPSAMVWLLLLSCPCSPRLLVHQNKLDSAFQHPHAFAQTCVPSLLGSLPPGEH